MGYTPNEWRPLDVITSEKLNELEKGLTKTSENVVYGSGGAQQSSDGIHSLTYIEKGDALPNHPQVGDTIYMKDGNDFSILEWDGEQWNTRIDPKLSERIQTTLDTAKADTADQITKNNDEIKSTIDEVAQEKIDLAIKDADFNENAQAMADKALADAKANTAQVAQDTLDSANQNLATAKSELTDGLQKEVSDRTSAVSALDTKAQGYVADAKKSLTTDIQKEVSDRTSAVSALDTKAQGYANDAKTSATTAINKEVSDRQQAINTLDNKSSKALDNAKDDINETINALSVGGRNYILDTANPKTQTSNGQDNQDLFSQALFYSPIKNWGIAKGDYVISFDWTLKTALSSDMNVGVFLNKPLYQGVSFIIKSGQTSGHVNLKISLWDSSVSSDAFGLTFRINSQMDSGNTITYSKIKMESGTIATDWTPAPEDVVLDYTTKDNQIKATITQYQQTNDGKVTKAQTDATTALGQVATKVSQTDYDTKTGDLTTKYTQVKQTADSQATDIVDIKETATSQASKINSISSDVDGTKQSISDIETTQDSQSDKINQITSDVNGTKQSITDIQTKDGKQDIRMGTIETSVSGVKSDFSTYKTDANGRISTAQTTAQTAVDGLKNKVSQTDYNTKTGQLQTDLTTTTQTANQAKIDIVSIKQKDSDQDAKMNTIVSDANGTKQTVSDLKTAQGKQSGDISTLQQRADGFDATVTKVDNLSVGGRNYVLNSSGLNGSSTVRPTLIGATSGANATITYPSDGILMINGATNKTIEWYYQIANAWTNFSATPLATGTQLTFSADVMGTVPQAVLRYGFNGGTGGKESFKAFDINNTSWTRVSITVTSTSTNTGLYFRIQGGMNNQYANGWAGGETLKFRNVKIESGNTATDWTPAPEDLSGATAKAQLTADQATTAINTYRTSNDGRVASAESKITQNATDITQKVSKTDYNQKTGQLQTDLNTTTNTANTAKQDIATIKTDNTTRDSKINTLESDSTETKRTISKLSGDLSTVSGDVSTLTQRADGFDATVTKVDNLAVGGRNYLISGTAALGWLGDNNIIGHNGSQGVVYDYISTTAKEVWSYSVWSDKQYTVPADGKYLRYTLYDSNKQQIMRKAIGLNMSTDTVKGQIVVDNNSAVAYIRVSIDWVANGYGHAKFEKGNIPTDWSPAPEDVDSATAKAQLTADNATTALSNYKTDADGRITKAQSDITQTAKDVTTKVSQSDYDKKTGDLTTAVSKAQTTADGIVTTVGNYKTSNDARVKAAESSISQNANAIALKVAKTDYDNNNSNLNTRFTKVEATANGASTTVGELRTAVNNLGQINQLFNTEFTPDFSGWYDRGSHGKAIKASLGTPRNGSNVIAKVDGSPTRLQSEPIAVTPGMKVSYSVNKLTSTGLWSYLNASDADGNIINIPGGTKNEISATALAGTTFLKVENITIPDGVYYISLGFLVNDTVANGDLFQQPMLVFGDSVGTYVQGNYNNNTALTQVKITADGVSDIVSNPTTGLSTRVQTAEGALSKVQGTDIPALQKATFWQPYSSLNFNDYTKQGSFFFNTTAAKTNGPTTSTAWIYLIVEQGTSDTSRIKQTAWYDGVAGVKVTYVRTLNSGTWSPWYANDNDSVTTISQTNSNITQEISDRKTGDNNTLQSSKDFTTSSITSYDNGIQSQFTQTASGILAQVESTNMVVNSEFDPLNGTWYALSNGGSTGSTAGVAWNAPKAGGFADWPVVNGSRLISYSTATWYTSALVTASAGKVFSASIVAARSPAPTVSTALDFRIGFWDSSRKLLTTASAGNIIDGTVYKGAQKYVVENKTAPANTAFVSVIIAHSSANATDYITRPSLNIGAKASPYTPTYGTSSSSTVLSLFKDNWSIGITDNISKITSGIVGNASQMSLISKNVTIDSPSTQITGTAWINSAMIQNGSIANANIADAAITSAKIAQLDVAKLTGNVSSFIQSNWNGNFGSTTIDSTGMEVKTGLSKTKFTNGSMQFITDLGENIGYIGRQVDSVHNNLDYLTFGLNGWHTTYPGDAHYDNTGSNTDKYYGGDGMLFGISNADGGYSPLLMWNSALAASYKSSISGWLFTQPIVGGIDIYGDDAASNKTVSMRFQNVKMSNGFTYPIMTSQQAAGSTGIVIGSGSTYMLGGNSFVWSVAGNGYAYYNTQKRGSSGSSLLMASDGAIIAQTSATKYKSDIEYEPSTSYGDKLLTIDPATWSDKNEKEQIQKYKDIGQEPEYSMNKDGARYYGLIAEDMVKAGLENLVVRNTDNGSVEGIQYEKIGIALIPLLREQRNQINELRVEIERLKEKTNE